MVKVRKRHPQFPISTGEDYEFLQPTSIVHVGKSPGTIPVFTTRMNVEFQPCEKAPTYSWADCTLDSALEASQMLLDIELSQYSRFQCVK